MVAAKGHHTHASQPVSLLPKQKINEDQRPQTSNHTMIEKQPDFSHNVRLAQSSNTVKKHLVSYSSTATDDLKNKSDHEKEVITC